MKQYVRNYEAIAPIGNAVGNPEGDSASPKQLLFFILKDNSEPIEVLDIGFGVGRLGELIKSNPSTQHWQVDGIDGFEPNCQNEQLINKKIYRNTWHGLAQELPSEVLKRYKIMCLLDVIEHLEIENSKYLLRHLLSSMADDASLFISTPLWFYPQDTQQQGDLEEHLIGVPASSMMALLPTHYAVSGPLVGGFVLSKQSLQYINFFHPTTDKSFSYEKGLKIAQAIGMRLDPGVAFTTGL
jgi:2-polyprenyl-3-methyl-5-hydroxy-6-metoxy-1,4-benzoquinol methylase